jgi:hypothetical protein
MQHPLSYQVARARNDELLAQAEEARLRRAVRRAARRRPRGRR